MNIISRTKAAFIIVLLALLVTACAGTVSSVDGGNAKIYIMSEQLASRVIAAAMKAEIDEENIQQLPAPKIGYKGKVQWGVDKDTITLIARKAMGKDQVGNSVSGYVFEARHIGTAPAAGAPTIKRLLANVVKDAGQLGQEASFERFVD